MVKSLQMPGSGPAQCQSPMKSLQMPVSSSNGSMWMGGHGDGGENEGGGGSIWGSGVNIGVMHSSRPQAFLVASAYTCRAMARVEP